MGQIRDTSLGMEEDELARYRGDEFKVRRREVQVGKLN